MILVDITQCSLTQQHETLIEDRSIILCNDFISDTNLNPNKYTIFKLAGFGLTYKQIILRVQSIMFIRISSPSTVMKLELI